MQLNISELNLYSDYEQIPENSIKVVKSVSFDVDNKPMHQSIPKQNAKISRPQTPIQKPKISYEDILSKMGMLVSDGKLHLVDRNTLTTQQQNEILSLHEPQYINPNPNPNLQENNYIYNKYFKDEIKTEPNIRKPRSLHEYKMMLVDNYLQMHQIKQTKSTKLMMPTTNINISSGNSSNFNKLFHFPKR